MEDDKTVRPVGTGHTTHQQHGDKQQQQQADSNKLAPTETDLGKRVVIFSQADKDKDRHGTLR